MSNSGGSKDKIKIAKYNNSDSAISHHIPPKLQTIENSHFW